MCAGASFSVDVADAGDPEVVLALHGEVDAATAPLLWERLVPELGVAQRLVLDCSDLQFIDATGVCVLERARAAMADQAELVLRAPTRLARRVFQILELDRSCVVEDGCHGPTGT